MMDLNLQSGSWAVDAHSVVHGQVKRKSRKRSAVPLDVSTNERVEETFTKLGAIAQNAPPVEVARRSQLCVKKKKINGNLAYLLNL